MPCSIFGRSIAVLELADNIFCLFFKKRLVHLEHVLAAMGGIADKFAICRVHDKIKMFQWNLPDEHGNSIRDLGYVDDAIAALNGKSNGIIHRRFTKAQA